MSRRYVIVDLHAEYPHEPVLDLPDAEHIHLTRRADGGWDAVPMVQVVAPDRTVTWGDAPWLDAPEQGDDR